MHYVQVSDKIKMFRLREGIMPTMKKTSSYLITLLFFVGIVVLSFYQVPPTVFEKNIIFATIISLLALALYNDGKG